MSRVVRMAEMGDEVLDPVSGFRGIVISITEYLHGCEQCGVQAPLTKEKKMGESFAFDRPRLSVVRRKKVKPGTKDTGGPVRAIPATASRR